VAGLCSRGVALHRAGRRLRRGCVMRVCAGLVVLVGVFGGVWGGYAGLGMHSDDGGSGGGVGRDGSESVV